MAYNIWNIRHIVPKRIRDKIKNRIRELVPQEPPVHANCYKYSMVMSAEDDNARPSEYLISLALKAIQNARSVSLNDISARIKSPPYSYFPDIWPGEHYKLLAGLVIELKPKLLIEIGTGQGLSALSMKKYLPQQQSKIITFDLIDWRVYPNSCLQESDFKDGRLIQYTDNLAEYYAVSRHARLLKDAEMIFIDGPKDGVTEYKIWDNFKMVSFNKKPLVVFDDIRLWDMLHFWRNISSSKLDLTSFGHWSGTGLVELE